MGGCASGHVERSDDWPVKEGSKLYEKIIDSIEKKVRKLFYACPCDVVERDRLIQALADDFKLFDGASDLSDTARANILNKWGSLRGDSMSDELLSKFPTAHAQEETIRRILREMVEHPPDVTYGPASTGELSIRDKFNVLSMDYELASTTWMVTDQRSEDKSLVWAVGIDGHLEGRMQYFSPDRLVRKHIPRQSAT